MPNVIWKYLIPMTDTFVVRLPAGAQIRTVAVQNDAPFLWAEFDPDMPIVVFPFRLVGTGHKIPDDVGEFVGTFFLGSFVGHIFHRKLV